MPDLNPRQAKFVREYIATSNATRAAMAAGYTQNPNAAGVTATRLLANAKIQQVLQQRLADTVDSPTEILAELRDLGTRAAEAGQFSPAVRAVELRGRAAGMWAEAGAAQQRVQINIFDSSVSFGDSHPDDGERVIEGESTSTTVSQDSGSAPDDKWE